MSWHEEAIAMRKAGLSYPSIAETLTAKYETEIHPEAARSAYRRRQIGTKVAKNKVTFEDMRQLSEGDVQYFIDAMLALQEAQDALDTKQVTATVQIDDDKPIGIAFWADWHIGGKGVDYDLFQSDLEAIKACDGLYVIGVGDYKDNYLSYGPAGAQYEQIIQPGMQDVIVLHYWEQVKDKVLALVMGCHDSWDKKMSDRDFIAACAQVANAINLWHGGMLTIKLGKQVYTGHIRHKYKYESSLNTTNAQRRLMEIYGPVDFACLAHLHNPEIGQRNLMGAMRWFLRSGSYKIWDEFGQKIGGFKGMPGVPVLILYPNQKRIDGFIDLQTGIDALNFARQ